MKALFTGALGDFIGAESFMTEYEKDSVTTLLWATRNRSEIQSAINLEEIFPNLKEQKILFDDFCDERPTRPWQPGDKFINIHKKDDLNRMCGLNLSQEELNSISDHSLDATLEGIFSRRRTFQTSRIATKMSLPDISKFNLPNRYAVIHPWSDAEINGREFNQNDWGEIYKFLENNQIYGVVINRSKHHPDRHSRMIDLTNQTSLQESFSILKSAEYCILCASSLATFATKIFPKNKIWLKGGHDHMFTQWATYFYHGPFIQPNEIIFKNLSIINPINNFSNTEGCVSVL
jgi:hypothetical protein